MEDELNNNVKAGVVLPEELQKKVKTKKPLEIDAQLSVDRNKWFLAFFGVLLFAFYQTYSANVANNRFANNVQVAWVKLSPNGTWDVTFPTEGQQPEFFKSTIDYLIRQFVERRYSKNKHSIKADYGFASILMSPKMKLEFLNEEQFYAPKVAADVINGEVDELKVKVSVIDHYDSDESIFNEQPGYLYRTNVFATETTINRNGLPSKPDKRIVSIKWRIKSIEEISAKKNELKLNPIGIEILESEYLVDPSGS